MKSTRDFIEFTKNIKLEPGEILISYDVSALFTCVPVEKAIEIIEEKLKADTTLSERTSLSIPSITQLLSFCLQNTCFTFQGQYYEQVYGASMGSPISPILANIYMEYFENLTLPSVPNPPRVWKRYVDDTFVIIKKDYEPDLFKHINSLDPNIKFTKEAAREDGSMPFLDTLVTPQADGALHTSVYRKPTHTDLYLRWDSHHSLGSKLSVVRTLYHRAHTVCSTPELLNSECNHIKTVLKRCGYPDWAIKKGHDQAKHIPCNKNPTSSKTKSKNKSKGYVIVPYVHGFSESYKSLMKKYNMEVYFRGANSIKKTLVKPKDKDDKMDKSGVIYRIKCNDCDADYVGEAGRIFRDRFKEHCKPKSPIYHHHQESGHALPTSDNVEILGREDHSLSRVIKESMFIRVNDPPLNRNIGKYLLPHIYDDILKSNCDLLFN